MSTPFKELMDGAGGRMNGGSGMCTHAKAGSREVQYEEFLVWHYGRITCELEEVKR